MKKRRVILRYRNFNKQKTGQVKRTVILGVVVLAIILIIVGRIVASKRGVKVVSVEERILVEVVEVIKGNLKEIVSYTGDVEAKERIEVYPRVIGKIIKKNVVEGDRIKKGQTIALIDRDEPGFKFEPAPVDSLLAGIVGRVYVDLGARVTPQTPIALIVDMDNIRVKIDIIEKDIPKVRKGQKAQIKVDAYPEKVFTGKVWKISPVVDLESRTAPVEILIPNPKHLLEPGMFARVEIITREHKDTLVVPPKAVLEREGKRTVFIVEESRALLKEVETGLNNENNIEIVKGLNEGEEVIIEGNYGLTDGAKVKME